MSCATGEREKRYLLSSMSLRSPAPGPGKRGSSNNLNEQPPTQVTFTREKGLEISEEERLKESALSVKCFFFLLL